MPAEWTTDSILALAPDQPSRKAALGLASPRKWKNLGRTDTLIWGECQGSASLPYQTIVELTEPRYHCTCPSRKHPCKHTLGLFLLLDSSGQSFDRQALPDWVQSWVDAHARQVEKKARAQERAAPTPDPQAQARRAAGREARVAAGVRELDTWLGDLIRQGVAHVQGLPASYWESAAARMVDAQAPGLGRWLREMASIPASGQGWQDRLLQRLGRLHLLAQAYVRIENLSPEVQADVRAQVGWTQDQEDLLRTPGRRDRWLVLGRYVYEQDRLRTQRTWLWGRSCSQPALVLDFSYGQQSLDASLTPGDSLEAELVFFPSAWPLRALVKERLMPPEPLDDMPGYGSLAEALAVWGRALARHPWLDRLPFVLREVTAASADEGWRLIDSAGASLPIAPGYPCGWELMALGGGRGLACVCEWNGESLLPLSAWAEGRFVSLHEG